VPKSNKNHSMWSTADSHAI